MARKRNYDTQDFKPVKRYSESDYRFDDEEMEESYQEESEDDSFLGKFTKERMIRFSSVFAGLVVIIIVIIAFFVRGKQVSKTLDNVNNTAVSPTVMGVVSPGAVITKAPGTTQGQVVAGCLNVTIVPGYIRPDDSVGTSGPYSQYDSPSGGDDEPEIEVTPEITYEPEDPTPDITDEPENPDDPDIPTPEVTEAPETPTDPVETPPAETPAPVDPVETPAPEEEANN